MKRFILCALVICLALMSVSALADGKLSEAILIYEDYDGNRAEQTVDEVSVLNEIEAMLTRASKNPAELDGCTMNCTLFCMLKSGEIYDFAIATDGCPFLTDLNSTNTYAFTGGDEARFWEIYDVVADTMGYNAGDIWDF